MSDEKKLETSSAVADAIEKNQAIATAKEEIRSIGLKDINRIKAVMGTVREIFPHVDQYLTPAEILGHLGVTLPSGAVKLPGGNAACPTCLSCISCQSCNTCQTCDMCQQCESCNTCQHQRGADTCPSESPVIRTADELIDPAAQVRAELINFMQMLSTQIHAG